MSNLEKGLGYWTSSTIIGNKVTVNFEKFEKGNQYRKRKLEKKKMNNNDLKILANGLIECLNLAEKSS